jgi:ABC-2 type transport system permease protein
MLSAFHLYLRYLGMRARAQMQYRASFAMLMVGHFVTTGIEGLSLWSLFDRFGSLRGWSLPEVAMFYGVVSVAFASAEILARGFDTFDRIVKTGEFDGFLLRPRSTILQMAGRQLALDRLGRFTQGFVVLVWSGSALGIAWSASRIILVVAAVVGGACLFAGLLVVQATICFWTVESLEIMNTMTYGGTETGQFPITIYQDWFRKFFTYVVPLACVTYFPIVAVLGRQDPLGTSPLFQHLAPLVGVAFLFASFQVWRFGVRHYCSTGS